MDVAVGVKVAEGIGCCVAVGLTVVGVVDVEAPPQLKAAMTNSDINGNLLDNWFVSPQPRISITYSSCPKPRVRPWGETNSDMHLDHLALYLGHQRVT